IRVYVPAATRYSMGIAGTTVLLGGGLITDFSHAEALAGGASLLAAKTVVVLFACVFLGLLFDIATAIGAALLVWHFAAGSLLGVGWEDLSYSVVILATAVSASLITSYKL